jgi:hypothetical protein
MKQKAMEFTFPDARGRFTRHKVTLYPLPNWTTVIVTDRSVKYKCASVTNAIECCINELIAVEKLNPERLVIIEHYDDLGDESFDLVKFDRLRDGSLHFPSWKHISTEEAHGWAGIASAA